MAVATKRLPSALLTWVIGIHDSLHGGYNACVNCHEKDKEITFNYCENCHVRA